MPNDKLPPSALKMSSPDSQVPTVPSAMSAKEKDVMEEYASSLEDLTVNSKPLINMLTMLADENRAFARVIVLAVEDHLQKVPSDIKLPVLYLIDSIMKNVGKPYPELFTQNIVSTFCGVFEKVDEKTRAQMFKLRHTWNYMFSAKKMYALDARVNAIDPAWPIFAPSPTTSIHLNPRFLSNVGSSGSSSPSVTTTAASSSGSTISCSSVSVAPTPGVASSVATTSSTSGRSNEEGAMNEAALRENLLKKKKELLELQQKKLELELLQTKKKLEEQEKQLEKTTGHLKSETKLGADGSSKRSAKVRPSSSHKSESSSRSDSKRSSKSQRNRTAVAAAIAAAEASFIASSTVKPSADATITAVTTVANKILNSAASTASSTVQKTKPCAPVAPVVSTPVVFSSPLMTNKVLKSADISNAPASSVPPIRISPVSTQLVKAVVRSRDPRLKHVESSSSSSSVPSVKSATVSAPVTPLSHSSLLPSTTKSSSSSVPSSSLTNTPPISVVSPLPQVLPSSFTSPIVSKHSFSDPIPVMATSNSVSTVSTPFSTTPIASITTAVSNVGTISYRSSTAMSVLSTPGSSATSNSSVNSNVLNVPSSVAEAYNKSKVVSDSLLDPVIKSPTLSPITKSKGALSLLSSSLDNKSKQIAISYSSSSSSSNKNSSSSNSSKIDKETVKKTNKLRGIDDTGGNIIKKNKKNHRTYKYKKNNMDSRTEIKKEVFVSEKRDDKEISSIKDNKAEEISGIKDNKAEEISGLKDNKSGDKSSSQLPIHRTDLGENVVSDRDVVRSSNKKKRSKFKVHKKLSNNTNLRSDEDIRNQNILQVKSGNINISDSRIAESVSEVVVDKSVKLASPKKLPNKELQKDHLSVADSKRPSSPKHLSPKLSPSKSSKPKSNKSPSPRSAVKNIPNVISLQEEKDDEIVPSPPPLLVSVDVSDKFKEMKASTIKRMKTFGRQRKSSVSPPQTVSAPSSGDSVTCVPTQPVAVMSCDTDLRVPPMDDVNKVNVVSGLESGKDVDLRALAISGSSIPLASELLPQSPKRPSAERELELPPLKKSKMDKIDALFGSEDTDMRQELGPPLPSPPPPPIISPLTEVDENSVEERSWAKYKQGKPDPYKSVYRYNSREEDIIDTSAPSFGSYRRNRVDRLGRPFLYHRSSHGNSGGSSEGGHSRSGRRRGDPSHHENEGLVRSFSNRGHYNYILREAEEQFKSGTMPISTYNRIIKEVITMNEQKKLDEAIRREEQENSHWRKRHHHPSYRHQQNAPVDPSGSPNSSTYGSVPPAPPPPSGAFENNEMMVTDGNEYESEGEWLSPVAKKLHADQNASGNVNEDASTPETKTDEESSPRLPVDAPLSGGSFSSQKDIVEEQLYNECSNNKQLNLSSSVEADVKPIISVSDVDFRILRPKPLVFDAEGLKQESLSLDKKQRSDEAKLNVEIEDTFEGKDSDKLVHDDGVKVKLDNKNEKVKEEISEDVAVESNKNLGLEEKSLVGTEISHKHENTSNDKIDFDDDCATDKTEFIKEKQEQSSDIDSRILPGPPDFNKMETEQFPPLLPPPLPYPQDVLKSLTDDSNLSQPQPPLSHVMTVLPDSAMIASKDTDLRIGQRPMIGIAGLPQMPVVSADIEQPKSVPMEYSDEFVEPKMMTAPSDFNLDMEAEQFSERMKISSSIKSREDRNQQTDVDNLRLHRKMYSKFPDVEMDVNRSKNSPQLPIGPVNLSSNIPVGPSGLWDQLPISKPSSLNPVPSSSLPGPGGIGLGPGAGPWTRQLLRPPAMMIQNQFWRNNPPLIPPPPPNMQQPLMPMSQIPPIRPPPPPPVGIFETDVPAPPGNARFPQHFQRPSTLKLPAPLPLPDNQDGRILLPPAEPGVLAMIAADTMRTINIDGVPREIRYYGETAVVMMAWDDPREIYFQGTPRRLTVNDNESILLPFNAPFKEFTINGKIHRVRYGGPTRELCIDTACYECFFGGPPINIEIGGKLCKIQLEGPPPQVRISSNKRTDLVAGKVNLIVDAREYFPIFLDPKPQRFDLDGVPHILRFVEALEVAVINGVSVRLEFGGLPKSIYSRGKKYFIGLSALPRSILPGYIDIINMEGGRRGSPPPLPQPELQPLGSGGPFDPDQENSQNSDVLGSYSNPVSPSKEESVVEEESMPLPDSLDRNSTKRATETPGKQVSPEQQRKRTTSKINSLDVLSSIITPSVQTPSSGYSYSVEQPTVETSATVTKPAEGAATASPQTSESKPKEKSSAIPFLGTLNVNELFQKLVATGIVPGSLSNITTSTTESTTAADDSRKPSSAVEEESGRSIKPVDFRKPETLKIRQPGLISILFSGIQCSSCGVRFPPEQTIKYSQHLDWHFRQNRRDRDSTRKAQSRKWYYDVSDWIQFEEIEDLEERAQSWFESQALQNVPAEEDVSVDVPSVPCQNGLIDVECEMCNDKFEQFYNEEKEEWHLRRAVRVDNKIYHPLCYDDYQNSLNAVQTEVEETKVEEEEEVEKDVELVPPPEEVDDDDDDDVIIQEPENKPIIIELLKDDDDEEEEQNMEGAIKKNEEEGETKLNETENSTDKNVESEDSKLDGDAVIIETDTLEDNETKMETDSNKELKDENLESGKIIGENEIQEIVKNIKLEPMDDVEEVESIIDLEHVIIKKEKIYDDEENLIPKPVVDTTHSRVDCSIDGNVELNTSKTILPTSSSKIKINISKPVIGHSQKESLTIIQDDNSLSQDEIAIQPPITSSALLNFVEPLQPPPPGEEPGPLHLKPRLVGKKLKEIPPVCKGTELSGLCSIM